MSNLSLFSTMLDCPVKLCKCKRKKHALFALIWETFCNILANDVGSCTQISKNAQWIKSTELKTSGLQQDTFSYVLDPRRKNILMFGKVRLKCFRCVMSRSFTNLFTISVFFFCQASFFQIQNEKGWSKDRLKPQLYRSSLSAHGVNHGLFAFEKSWNTFFSILELFTNAIYLIFFSNLSSLSASFFPRLKYWSVIAVGKADRGGLTSVQPS